MRSYCIKRTGKYNYSITVPKWLVEQLGELSELFWIVADDKVYLSKERPYEEPQKEKTRKLRGWTLILNQLNPNISLSQETIFGYNFSLRNYFFISTKLNINLIGEKDELLDQLKEKALPIPPNELLIDLDEYISNPF